MILLNLHLNLKKDPKDATFNKKLCTVSFYLMDLNKSRK